MKRIPIALDQVREMPPVARYAKRGLSIVAVNQAQMVPHWLTIHLDRHTIQSLVKEYIFIKLKLN